MYVIPTQHNRQMEPNEKQKHVQRFNYSQLEHHVHLSSEELQTRFFTTLSLDTEMIRDIYKTKAMIETNV